MDTLLNKAEFLLSFILCSGIVPAMSGKRQKSPSNPTQTLVQTLRRPDLSILGGSITSLPRAQWCEQMLFFNVPDTDLLAMTGSFPARLRPEKVTHPIFTLRCHPAGHFVCPCSSTGAPSKQRYMRQEVSFPLLWSVTLSCKAIERLCDKRPPQSLPIKRTSSAISKIPHQSWNISSYFQRVQEEKPGDSLARLVVTVNIG